VGDRAGRQDRYGRQFPEQIVAYVRNNYPNPADVLIARLISGPLDEHVNRQLRVQQPPVRCDWRCGASRS
jgi:hypothetical protein